MSSTWKKKRILASLLVASAWPLAAGRGANSDGWRIEVVEAAATGKFSSMKIDTAGNVHLIFVLDDGGYAMKYAFWDRRIQKWFVMPVDESVGMCALTLDSKQRPQISYADYGSGFGTKLRHAWWDGASWRKEAIRLDSEIIAYYNSIAMDAQDHPSLSFYEYRGPKDSDISIRLRNVLWNGTRWEVRTVDPDGGSGKFNSMAADSKGRLHLAYANVGAGDMRYALWDGKSWTR